MGYTTLPSVDRGSGFSLTVIAVYKEGHILAGLPFPLADKTIWFTAKKSLRDLDEDAVIAKKNGAGITVLPPEPGEDIQNQAKIEVAADDTKGLPSKTVRLEWDVQVKEVGQEPFTLERGDIRINADVTQATE